MRSRLATRFSATILGVVALAILSSLVTLYAAWRVSARLDEAGQASVSSARAEEMQIAILKGDSLLASYLLEKGNPLLEGKIRTLEPQFHDWITTVRGSTTVSDEENDLLLRLRDTGDELDSRREEVISLCKKGELDRARSILTNEINARLSPQAYDLCGQWIAMHERAGGASLDRARRRMRLTTWAVGVSSSLTLLLGGFLLWLFFYRVLFPLRGMVADAQLHRGQRGANAESGEDDELRAMGNYLRGLLSDVSDTRSRLERSRSQLLAAEKLAAVGKIAATVAHEIRNPLTAMKLWLFSLQEAVRGNAELSRKLAVISEEIERLEAIVRNFLEFSRPLELHCRAQAVDGVISHTIELLGPRFQAENIRVVYSPRPDLPPVMADSSQLKQVLLNLLGNAADAMPPGGEIRIAAAAQKDADGRSMLAVRISDAGPGMPADVQRRVFEPFFSTKEKGTGLGLCIAAQIMARHGGELVLESSTEKGTVFALWIPLAPEEGDGQDSRS